MNYLDLAALVAEQSPMRKRVGAVLVRNGNILSVACNMPGKGTPGSWSRHAEVRATLNRNCKGATLYVARRHRITGELLIAKPCQSCEMYLKELNLKRILFSK